MSDTFHGVVAGVYAEDLGDQLAADAAIGATSLQLLDVGDFDIDDGGVLLLNGAMLAYTGGDDDAATLDLAAPLAAAALTDDRVDVWDAENGTKATIYKAVISELDGMATANPVEAIVDQRIASSLTQQMRDGKGESVTLARDDDGTLTLTNADGRADALATLQYLQGGMTTRTSEDDPGVDILGADSGQPGVYVYGAGGSDGSRIVLRDDGSEGILEFFAGVAGETAGAINPTVAGGQHGIEIATSHAPSSPNATPGRLTIWGSATGQPLGYVEIPDGDLILSNGSITVTANISANGDVTGNRVFAMNPDPTSNIENVRWASAGGQFTVVGSRSRLKLKQQKLSVDAVRGVLNLTPKTWFDRAEVKANGGSTEGLRRIPGLIAEDVEKHCPALATYDDAGELHGVAYSRVPAFLIPLVRELYAMSEDQQKTISDQQKRIEALEAAVAKLTEGR